MDWSASPDSVGDDLVASIEIADPVAKHTIGKHHIVRITHYEIRPPAVLGLEDAGQRAGQRLGLILWCLKVDEGPYRRLGLDRARGRRRLLVLDAGSRR